MIFFTFISMAPIMCEKFVQCCVTKEGPSYQGTIFYQVSVYFCTKNIPEN